MKKRLLLNADDYGWDADANAGILDLVRTDKINNVTILANHCASDALYAIRSFQDNASLGLHVCLNAGSPLSADVSSLQDSSGNFYDSKNLFQRAVTGRIKYADILKEIKAQYAYLSDHGIHVTHADSHQHIHQYPVLSAMVTQALHDVGIKKIRRCNPVVVTDFRRYLIYIFYLMTKNNLKHFVRPDVLVTDFTHADFSFSTDVPAVIKKLSASGYKNIEWMCHPALENKTGSYLQRKAEYLFLKNCDWDELLKDTAIERSQYKFL